MTASARTSYMPAKQAAQVGWSNTFANGIETIGAATCLSTVQIEQFGAVNADLQAAWAVVQNPATKTRATVSLKDDALKNMRAMAKKFVSIVQGSNLSDAQKINLGVTVRSIHPRPRPAPDTAPFIKVLRTQGRTVLVELQQDSTLRGRPAGVHGATVFTHVGPTVPTSAGAWQFAATVTRTNVTLPFPPGPAETAWITAMWTNAKGQSGPSAVPASASLPAGGALPGERNETASLKIAA